MPVPLVALAAGIAGTAVGGAVGSLFGGTKKEETITTTTTYGQVYHAPGEIYAPQIQYSPQTGYSYTGATYIINSPSAISKKSSTLEQSSTPTQTGSWDVPQSYETSPEVSSGTFFDKNTLILVAVIGAVAVVGYGLVSGGKR